MGALDYLLGIATPIGCKFLRALEIKIPEMPHICTSLNVGRWSEFNLRPIYLPSMEITLETELPCGWQKLGVWFYEQLAAGRIADSANRLIAGWYLADFTSGADTNQKYLADDPMAPLMVRLRRDQEVGRIDDIPDFSRFGITSQEWQRIVSPAFAATLNLAQENVRLEKAVAANAVGNIYDASRGGSNIRQLYEDVFTEPEAPQRTHFGLNGGVKILGGLSHVSYDTVTNRLPYAIGRLMVKLS